MRSILIALAIAGALAQPAKGAPTDLERMQKLVRRIAVASQSDEPGKAACACQGGVLDGRIGSLDVVRDPTVGAYIGCYAVMFNMEGAITGKTQCQTYVVLPR